jgi:hypothetical protein
MLAGVVALWAECLTSHHFGNINVEFMPVQGYYILALLPVCCQFFGVHGNVNAITL